MVSQEGKGFAPQTATSFSARAATERWCKGWGALGEDVDAGMNPGTAQVSH